MADRLIERSFRATLRARADLASSERIIEGVIVPFDTIADVRDSPSGPAYRESIARGATDGLEPTSVILDYLVDPPRSFNTHEGSKIAGRGVAGEATDTGHVMRFRVARTANGDELLGLTDSSEGPPVLADLSVQFKPVAERRRADGVLERTAIDIRRVTVVPQGAYAGAQVTASRADTEGDMPNTQPPADETAGAATDDTTATPPPANSDRPNRTRVTVDVERAQAEEDRQRAAAERGTVAELSRGGGSRSPMVVTRAERVYGPHSGHSFLADGWLARQGNQEAAERWHRHQAQLGDVAVEIERAHAWDGGELARSYSPGLMSRAGDVLSSEIPGAYPNDYLPGLLTPRITKGRPMGGFYDRFPIADARPRIFPKVTTSTAVVVQSAEGAALGATDFATTAVTVTPLIYGAYTDVSRQVLDGADPAANSMLLQDLIEAYAQASETVVKTAVEAGSTASGVAITAATPYAGVLANVINYFAVRFKSATAAFIPSAEFPVLATQGDTTGRPFLPMIGAINSDGQTLATDLDLELAVLTARGKLSYASTVNVNVFGRPNDFVTFESSVASFSYDQVVGPQAVRVGIWAYLVVGTRLGSLKVTAA